MEKLSALMRFCQRSFSCHQSHPRCLFSRFRSFPFLRALRGAFCNQSNFLRECRRRVESCFAMHTFTISRSVGIKEIESPAWCARTCTAASPSCSRNYRGEQRELAARTGRDDQYSLTKNTVRTAPRNNLTAEARILLRTVYFWLLFLDSSLTGLRLIHNNIWQRYCSATK